MAAKGAKSDAKPQERTKLAYLAVSAVMTAENITATEVAKRAGITSACMTGLSQGDRPSPSTLGGLCAAVRGSAAEVAAAHCLDELVRAGLAASMLSIRPTGRPHDAGEAQRKADMLAAIAERNPAVFQLLTVLERVATEMPYNAEHVALPSETADGTVAASALSRAAEPDGNGYGKAKPRKRAGKGGDQ